MYSVLYSKIRSLHAGKRKQHSETRSISTNNRTGQGSNQLGLKLVPARPQIWKQRRQKLHHLAVKYGEDADPIAGEVTGVTNYFLTLT